MLTKEEFNDCFYANYITDCAVRNKNVFAFAARNGEESEENDLTGEWNVTKYACRLYMDKEDGQRIGKATIKGWNRLYCTASILPSKKLVYISAEGVVYIVGPGVKKNII